MNNPNILVAPLNWGLGHATRCIPIIKALKENGFNPIIASDGNALDLLHKEFPELVFEELPSYQITYSKNKNTFYLKLFSQLPHIYKTIKNENKVLKQLIKKHQIKGIISDNRLGIYHKEIPSVYITHQTKVYSGIFTKLTSKYHQKYIKKHNECWIPDNQGAINLSGKLSHNNCNPDSVKFIGPLSRFENFYPIQKYDYCAVLSGPEPQRSILEKLIKEEFTKTTKTIAIIGCNDLTNIQENIKLFPIITSPQLEKIVNESKVIISRSGYTSIMDLAFLNKKCLLIPTPGQKEQEYLAKKLKEEGQIFSIMQNKFSLKKLKKVDLFQGFRTIDFNKNWSELFKIFQ